MYIVMALLNSNKYIKIIKKAKKIKKKKNKKLQLY